MTSTESEKSKNNTNVTEMKLLQRVAEEERVAFDQLFRIYHPRLFKFLFRLTRSHGAAEELASDVLLTLWTDAGRFRGESKVSTWIFGIAYRQALAHLRKRKLTTVSLLEGTTGAVENDTIVEREDWVRQSIERLPPKQKLTVMLVYFLGLTCEEAATASGVPVSTVKTRMFHARKKMKHHLVASRTPPGLQGGEGQRDNTNDQ